MLDESSLPVTPYERSWDKIHWTAFTIAGKKCFMKRSVDPREFRVDRDNHRVVSFTNSANAVRNEKLAIDYVREHTSIPVPNIVFYLDEGDRVYLATEVVEGVTLGDIEDPKDEFKVCKQLDAYVTELETHRSSKIRGFGVDVCLPVHMHDLNNQYESEKYVEVEGDPFVLCHGDLHPGNVIVDPETMKVKAVIDWEFAGYYPAIIDNRRYKNYHHCIVHLADGSLVPQMTHAKRARELLRRYGVYYKEEIQREGRIEIVDGEPVYRYPSPDKELPDPNKVFVVPPIALNAVKRSSEAEAEDKTAADAALATDVEQTVG
ncbi:Aminoglycoside phosphotransferase [Kalmanozyma brasiliensis GHG001]|uniref:Aminoglycoside phosphotransferase n=1 Tax=Kalmanozyma brasiliensis (strain GHG001) TaxID=1365824 RepID=UPI002867E86A|nr:Aminoglycoside phosphotransferase [Kalmanozyma brasiliensis GHG001]KAF6766907.1 Aminoglycoside phosphotransferase [Kalmanozyma brasiliensis GHG001]